MMTKVRLGHLMVLATVGRMLKWPAYRRGLCGDGIETVQHFVSDCKFLARQDVAGDLFCPAV